MIKVGIIGIGNIGSAHAKALAEGKIEGMTLAALCDCSPERKQWAKERFPAIPFFDNSDDFFARSGVDAVIIATPHYLHPVLALQGFRCGMHVMSEKPAGVSVSSLHPLYEEARRSGKRFGIMWNQRTNPLYADVRRMVQDGTLGTPQRLIWQATDWYRTQEYYDSGSWRATWAGEGGGVLMNQAPHQLDLMQWIFGLPDHVRAECSVGKYHNIEVEDDD